MIWPNSPTSTITIRGCGHGQSRRLRLLQALDADPNADDDLEQLRHDMKVLQTMEDNDTI